jgi:hypothetical protein
MSTDLKRTVVAVDIQLSDGSTHRFSGTDLLRHVQGAEGPSANTKGILAIFFHVPGNPFHKYLFADTQPEGFGPGMRTFRDQLATLDNSPAYLIKDIECLWYPSE